MGFTADQPMKTLWPEDLPDKAGRAIVDAVGTRFRDRVAIKTPVARLPKAYKGDFSEWIADRKRKPRTLRDSWERSEVIPKQDGHEVEIFTMDPVAPHVEWDTRPHSITAGMRVDPRTGELRQGSLRFPMGPNFMFRKEVWHPGTQGKHMMRDTAAEIETLWLEVAERELEELIARENLK